VKDVLQWIMPIVVGAVIGLFTNWLAIVMLFRPHRPLKLFGMRMPFTPGLIPRRHADLADKLGEVVENDLLTPEGLAKSLKRPTVEFAVKRAAVRSLSDALSETPTLGGMYERFFGVSAKEALERALTAKAVAWLGSEEGRARLFGLGDALFDHLRESLSTEDVRRELARGFAEPLHVYVSQGMVTWREALPESVRRGIAEKLDEQVGPLLQGAGRWLAEPPVVLAISQMLTEKVENIPLIGAMAKGFLTPERVADDIVPRLQSVVTSGRTETLVRQKVQDTLDWLWERPVGQFLGKMSREELGALFEKVLDVLMDRALHGEASAREMFRGFVAGGIAAGANERTAGDLVRRMLDSLAAFDLRALYVKHTDDVDRWIGRAWRFLQGKLVDAMPELLDALSIKQVVREQVLSYPLPKLEKLIVSVVNQELRMITLLGGLLGAVIGLIQVLVL
jgi:uncharacterized membrane protein YheB (UPF0754 family)